MGIINPGSTSGALLNVQTKTTTYTLTTADDVIEGNATTASFTVTLPTAVGISGKLYRIKKTDSSVNRITVATTSAQTIDNLTTVVMGTQFDVIELVSDGSNWAVTVNSISVVAVYGLTTSQAVTSGAVLKYDTKIKDPLSAYSVSTGLFTAPMSGEFRFSVAANSSVAAGIFLKKNGTAILYITTSVTGAIGGGSSSIPLAAGDTVGFFLDATTTSSGTAAQGYNNSMSIERTGN